MSERAGVTFFNDTFYYGAIDGRQGWDLSKDHHEPLAKLNASKEWGDGRIEIIAHERWRAAERKIAAGAIDEDSVSNITVIQLLDEVIRREYRQVHVREAYRTVPVPKLQLDVPIAGKYTASEDVPELVAADQKANSFTQANLRLTKNVVDIYESDESRLKANFDPLTFEIDQAAGALAIALNGQLVTELTTNATDRSRGGDWSAINGTHGRSSRNPLSSDITPAIEAIQNNHFRPSHIVMAPTDASNYLTNTFINGQFPAENQMTSGIFPLPKYPGITAVVDLDMTDETAVIVDKSAVLLGEGPTVAENFRDPHRGADGWVIRQWKDPLITTGDATELINSLAS